MQQIRKAIYLVHWWIANAMVVAVPTYGLLRAQGIGGFHLVIEVAAALIVSAFLGRLAEWAWHQGQMMGAKASIVNRVLALIASDGVVFATCFVGWGALSSMPGNMVPFIVAAVFTIAARRMRVDSAELAAFYGLR